jgi:GH15 family glucan-1,4-alpha-glucosidase
LNHQTVWRTQVKPSLDALYQGRAGHLSHSSVGWELQRALAEHLESIWQLPDEGIWEPRAGRRQFTHSKVMPRQHL